MFFATVFLCHVLGAIGVGPIFTLPFLANTPAALHAVLDLLRFGAGATLLSEILLWLELKPGYPLWLYFSSVIFRRDRIDCSCARTGYSPQLG